MKGSISYSNKRSVRRTEARLFTLIGQISVSVSFMESIMRAMIGILVRNNSSATHRKIDCIVAGDTFVVLLSKLTNLFHFVTKDEVALTEFEKLRKLLAEINTERNTYVHSIWGIEGDEIYRWKTRRHIGKSKSMLEFEENFDIAKLTKIAKKTEIVTNWMLIFEDVFISKMFKKEWYEKKSQKFLLNGQKQLRLTAKNNDGHFIDSL